MARLHATYSRPSLRPERTHTLSTTIIPSTRRLNRANATIPTSGDEQSRYHGKNVSLFEAQSNFLYAENERVISIDEDRLNGNLALVQYKIDGPEHNVLVQKDVNRKKGDVSYRRTYSSTPEKLREWQGLHVKLIRIYDSGHRNKVVPITSSDGEVQISSSKKTLYIIHTIHSKMPTSNQG